MIFFFCSALTSAQNKKKIDSLLQVVKTSDNDSIKMITYSRLRRATYYSDIKVAKKYTYKYLELAKKRKDSFHIAISNLYLGNIAITQSDYENALNKLFKSVDYFERKKDSVRMCSILNSIGAVYLYTDNDSLAIVYFKRIYKITSSNGGIRRNAIAGNNLATIYNENGRFDIGIPYLEKAESDLTATKYREYYISISLNLANAYRDTKAFNKALPIYNRVLAKLDTTNDVINHGLVLTGLAKLNVEFKKNQTALKQLEKAYSIYTKADYFNERYELLPELIKLYKITGKHKKGLDLFYKLNTIKDSVFSIEKDKNLAEAIQKYEAEKKEAKLKILKKEQELTLEKQRSRNLIVSIIIGAFILLLLFLWFRNVKRKALYQQQNEITKLKLLNEQSKSKHYLEKLKQYTQLMIAKNNQIKDLQYQLENVPLSKEMQQELGAKLNSLYNATILTNDDWNVYRAMFDQVYPEFIQNITNQIPSISSGDLKMAAMLKLNLSNPEVASILGISDESVRKSKYRLRKKLDINSNSELQTFINKIL